MSGPLDGRFAPPQAHVEDLVEPGTDVLAGRGIRLGALLIDCLIVAAPAWLLTYAPGIGPIFEHANDDPLKFYPASALLSFLLFALLHGWTLVQRGQTLGKMMCRIRIVRSDGSKADPFRVLVLRYGVGYATNVNTVLGLLFALADIALIFRASRRCLHDAIADTKVIKL